MEKIKRFITCHIPVSVCNFRCQYCYLHSIKKKEVKLFILEPHVLANKLSVERLGGICYFNLCADGETMIHPQLIDLIKELTNMGHYVDIITNGVLTEKFDKLLKELDSNQQKNLMIKFSFHYLELKRTGLLDMFVSNVKKISISNISYSIEITPHDELIAYIDEIKSFSIENFGAYPHITVARDADTRNIEVLTKLSREDYKKTWGEFESAMFNFKLSTFNCKRNEFCYAGDWSLKLDLGSGEYRQCYVGATLGNICDDAPIKFKAIGRCQLPHCFNGHAFLALGNIPDLSSPTYAEERDRITKDGEHWLKSECREFFSTKLYNTNTQYTNKLKRKCNIDTKKYNIKVKINRLIKRLKNE